MPRPKGSKNKVKVPKGAAVDFASAIAAKDAEKDQLNEELASIQAGIADLKAQLKEKRAALASAVRPFQRGRLKIRIPVRTI